jgi:hypothetical protein
MVPSLSGRSVQDRRVVDAVRTAVDGFAFAACLYVATVREQALADAAVGGDPEPDVRMLGCHSAHQAVATRRMMSSRERMTSSRSAMMSSPTRAPPHFRAVPATSTVSMFQKTFADQGSTDERTPVTSCVRRRQVIRAATSHTDCRRGQKRQDPGLEDKKRKRPTTAGGSPPIQDKPAPKQTV